MTEQKNIVSLFKQQYHKKENETLAMAEYLERCSQDYLAYATASERMLEAFGEPEVIEPKNQTNRQRQIFANRTIKRYPAFKEFYGVEEAIEQIVSYFRHAAQGLEEKKQILYLLGPVGGGKSSLAEELKKLMEAYPIYTIQAYNYERGEWEISPVYESPLGLFDENEQGPALEEQYNIPVRYTKTVASPWAMKRLHEVEGDIEKFRVVKVWPSILNQVGVAKTEPGDENNQDISDLVGKVDIRQLEDFSQHDPDAYSYAGGLNLATQGILEFVEMFKAPQKMLHPLLTATQEGNYNGTQGFGAMPFNGIILAHSNESEWEQFAQDRRNEAFLDRVCIVKVPYCLRVTEEKNIYEKLINNSSLANAPIAPGTLDMLAKFSVLTRLEEPTNSNIYTKMRVYDGESLKDEDPQAKSYAEYRDNASSNEGMSGRSTRFAYKILSRTFNYDDKETAANPVHLMYILKKQIEKEDTSEEEKQRCIDFINSFLGPKYAEFIGEELQKAFLESYEEFGQNLFDRYFHFADAWTRDEDYADPDTGEMMKREVLEEELEKLEKPAGVANPKDFRHDVVNWVLRWQARHKNDETQGAMPNWKEFEKIRPIIEQRMFANTEEMLPIITFDAKATEKEKEKHEQFLDRMVARGYTKRQVNLLVDWYNRYYKNS